MRTDEDLIAENEKLLTKGDDSEVHCELHNVTRRWGDMSPLAQLACLAGLDAEDSCLLES